MLQPQVLRGLQKAQLAAIVVAGAFVTVCKYLFAAQQLRNATGFIKDELRSFGLKGFYKSNYLMGYLVLQDIEANHFVVLRQKNAIGKPNVTGASDGDLHLLDLPRGG